MAALDDLDSTPSTASTRLPDHHNRTRKRLSELAGLAIGHTERLDTLFQRPNLPRTDSTSCTLLVPPSPSPSTQSESQRCTNHFNPAVPPIRSQFSLRHGRRACSPAATTRRPPHRPSARIILRRRQTGMHRLQRSRQDRVPLGRPPPECCPSATATSPPPIFGETLGQWLRRVRGPGRVEQAEAGRLRRGHGRP